MNQINSLLPLRNARSASAFYSKSPFRDNVFLGTTFMLFADLTIAAVILIKCWNHLPARTVFYLGLVLFGLVSMWRWALKSHSDARVFLESSKLGRPDVTSTVGEALSIAANMTYLGLFYTFLLVGICLMELGESL